MHLSGRAQGVSQEMLLEPLVQEDQTRLVDGPSGKSDALFPKRPVATAAATAAASCHDLNDLNLTAGSKPEVSAGGKQQLIIGAASS